HYSNAILHVVMEDDQQVLDLHGAPLPALELRSRIPSHLVSRFRRMMAQSQPIICHSFLPALSQSGWKRWKEQLLIARLNKKSSRVLEWLSKNGDDWNTIFWWLMFEQTGGKVNGDFFLALAKSIPLPVLLKKQLSRIEWESLLLGQSNLLPVSASDAFWRKMVKEYQYLSYKYQLHPLNRQPAFLRMRPASFPTIRIAQLAGLLLNNPQLFSSMVTSVSLHQWKQQCRVSAEAFWDTHYLFNKTSQSKPKTLGIQMMYSLAINAILPTLYAYGYYTGNRVLMHKVLLLFKEIPAEQNRITSIWDATGINQMQAFDTQALTELTNRYCTQKNCLQCAVGQQVLKVNLLPDKLHI
ncbi:MAG: DUF2851 family protein, partial [Sediminibacterium sp.]|nr:DUF2851 family protein [Sediminibacterium sp.]